MRPEQQQSQCDPRLLRGYLEQRLTAVEEAALEAHLDACDSCRRRIYDSAAEPDWWDHARRYLRPDAWDANVPSSTGGLSCVESSPHSSHAAEVVVRQIQDWLDPADDPQFLGRFGGYEVLGVIGYGGMGVVLKGLERSLNRYVAIKVLSPVLATSGAARKRFEREAKAAAAVLHENVIAIYRVAEVRGLPYLVMPYIGGVSLQRRIDEEGPLPLPAILRISRQIAAGLAAAHAQGLVHRDIKPANILLERDVERVTITDFGLARAADDGSVTRTGFIAGTPQYMSPEQARGESIDARSDLFSLGSVMYAMAAGRPPFRAETSYGIMRRITDGSPKPLREINSDAPEWFASIVERLHAKPPGERIQSAEELAELLERCLAHVQQPTASPLPPSLSVTRKARGGGVRFHRRRAGQIAMFAGAGALAAMLAWGLGHRDRGNARDGSSAAASPSTIEIESHAGSFGAARWEDGVSEQLQQVESDLPQFEAWAAQRWDPLSNMPITGPELRSPVEESKP
jgi:eukaryotic-like serine/threonine-protein kinase